MIRITEHWAQRKQRKARINAELAAADAAEHMAWVDRKRIPQQPIAYTDAQCERIGDMLAEPGEWGQPQ
jgi:hypothetical protein